VEGNGKTPRIAEDTIIGTDGFPGEVPNKRRGKAKDSKRGEIPRLSPFKYYPLIPIICDHLLEMHGPLLYHVSTKYNSWVQPQFQLDTSSAGFQSIKF